MVYPELLLLPLVGPLHRERLCQEESERMEALKKPAEKNFYAGERVPDTGIYFVMHGDHHRAPHELTLLAEAKFPACSVCRDDVQFRLLHSAPYLFEDGDFSK